MKIADNASIDDNTHGGGEIPPCTGLTPMSSPKFWSQVWRRTHIQGCPPEMPCREQMTNRVEIQSLL